MFQDDASCSVLIRCRVVIWLRDVSSTIFIALEMDASLIILHIDPQIVGIYGGPTHALV